MNHAPCSSSTPQRSQWKKILTQLGNHESLTSTQTQWALENIISGNATSSQISAFGIAMKMKPATPEELADLANTMLAHSPQLPDVLQKLPETIDIVGTGGDGHNTVNISTMAAIVVAATGTPVIKYGNRATSSQAGGADTLEALGIRIDMTAAQLAHCIQQLGIGFCFAPKFSPSYQAVRQARQEIGAPTIFNILGPLTNPVRPYASLIGCSFPSFGPIMAQASSILGQHSLVIHNDDGLDELSTTSAATIWIGHHDGYEEKKFNPCEFGFAPACLEALVGSDAQYNAQVIHQILQGQSGPIRDAVILNAAGALMAYYGCDASWEQSWDLRICQAQQALDTGAAYQLLQQWIVMSETLNDTYL